MHVFFQVLAILTFIAGAILTIVGFGGGFGGAMWWMGFVDFGSGLIAGMFCLALAKIIRDLDRANAELEKANANIHKLMSLLPEENNK